MFHRLLLDKHSSPKRIISEFAYENKTSVSSGWSRSFHYYVEDSLSDSLVSIVASQQFRSNAGSFSVEFILSHVPHVCVCVCVCFLQILRPPPTVQTHADWVRFMGHSTLTLSDCEHEWLFVSKHCKLLRVNPASCPKSAGIDSSSPTTLKG